MTDRQIATLLDRSLESVRSQRQRLIGPRWTSPYERWIGSGGNRLEHALVEEYLSGASQSLLSDKYRVEWSKLRQILLSHEIAIRDKSQQAFVKKHGRNPRITPGLGASKLYIIFAMFGDGLRPTTQARRNTHTIGIAAGKGRDFAENWIINFEREYSARPNLKTLGPNNIQSSISSTDIWNDLHRYATFVTRSWSFPPCRVPAANVCGNIRRYARIWSESHLRCRRLRKIRGQNSVTPSYPLLCKFQGTKTDLYAPQPIEDRP